MFRFPGHRGFCSRSASWLAVLNNTMYSSAPYLSFIPGSLVRRMNNAAGNCPKAPGTVAGPFEFGISASNRHHPQMIPLRVEPGQR
jgi:hypothetical protein